MASGIVGDDGVTARMQPARRGGPSVAILTTTMQEKYDGAGGVVSVEIRCEGDAVFGADSLAGNGHLIRPW